MDKTGLSILQVYSKAARLRQEPSFLNNEVLLCDVTDHILSYIRHTPGYPAYHVTLNLGEESSYGLELSDFPDYVLQQGDIVLTSGVLTADDMMIGNTIELKDIKLHPGEACIVKLKETFY